LRGPGRLNEKGRWNERGRRKEKGRREVGECAVVG
jgi:hypothetical protein